MVGHVPLIYREFHTPDLVLQRSQFLCTVYVIPLSNPIPYQTSWHPTPPRSSPCNCSRLADQNRICAIAARYYDKKPTLHGSLSAYAKRLAFEVPSRGYKSVEVVQAYLLLSLWTLGPEKT